MQILGKANAIDGKDGYLILGVLCGEPVRQPYLVLTRTPLALLRLAR